MKRLSPVLMLCLCSSLLVADQVEPTFEPRVVSREFQAEPERAREALLALLAEKQLELDPEAPEGVIQTLFSEFEAKSFDTDNVGEPGPKLTRDYVMIEPVKVPVGRLRVRGRLEAAGEGTRVFLEVDLLVRAFHELVAGTVENPRRSNGAIETYLLDRLEESLGKPGPSGSPGESD